MTASGKKKKEGKPVHIPQMTRNKKKKNRLVAQEVGKKAAIKRKTKEGVLVRAAEQKKVAEEKVALRSTGTIKKFNVLRQHGFITLDNEPDVELLFYVNEIVGYDGNEKPFLAKGTPVEFFKVKGDKGFRASKVSQRGGGKLVFVAKDPSKNYNNAKLYTGVVSSYKHPRGYGWITCDEETIEWGGKTAKKEKVVDVKEDGGEPQERLASILWFSGDEVIGTSDLNQGLFEGDKVRFNVYINDRALLGAGQVHRTSKSKNKRKLEWAKIQYLKRMKIPRRITQIEDYLIGNFRGALQEYFQQKSPTVRVEYQSKTDPRWTNLFLATARAKGSKDEMIEGRGHSVNKKGAIKYAALDLIFKLNLVSKEEHKKIHNVENI